MNDGEFIATGFMGIVIGCMFSLLTCVPGARELGKSDGKTNAIRLVEDCWPNKPAWNSRDRACWVNGQRVILED